MCEAESPSFDTTEKPGLPVPLRANPSNVYGNLQTQAIERKLISLLRLVPRPMHGETNPAKLSRIYAEMQRLVGTVQSPEELERFAYWCIRADKGWQPDSELNIDLYASSSAMIRLKEKYPAQARARIYELNSLVRADGQVGENIGELLTGSNEKLPSWSPPCCYISILKHGESMEQYGPTSGCIAFNVTRILQQKWHKYWTGRYRFSVQGSFVLQPDGAIRELKIFRASDVLGNTVEQLRQAEANARRVITTSAPFPAMPKIRRSLQVEFELFD